MIWWWADCCGDRWRFESSVSMTVQSSTRVCSFGRQVVEKLEARMSFTVIVCLHRRHGQDKTVLSCLQLCSHHRLGQDKTVLSCPCRRCKQAILVANWKLVETRQNSSKLGRDKTKLSCRRCEHNWRQDKTRQDKTVLSCLRRQCEQAVSELGVPSCAILTLLRQLRFVMSCLNHARILLASQYS